MAATAAALSAHIQVQEDAQLLIEWTNWGSSGSTLDTTVLESFCQTAINWFKASVTSYDPDTYGVHQDIAAKRAMMLLAGRAKAFDAAKDYESAYRELLPGIQRRRTFTPVTNSVTTYEPDDDNTGRTVYAPFGRNHFADTRPNGDGQSDEPNT